MISALPVSGAWHPNTIDAHCDRPRISLSSASFSWPKPWPPSSGPRCVAHRPALAHLVLQRVDDRPPGVVERVELQVGEEQVERLDLLPHERVDPVELGLVLGVGPEIPCHRVCSSLVAAQNRILGRAEHNSDSAPDDVRPRRPPGAAGRRGLRRARSAACSTPRSRSCAGAAPRRGPGWPTSSPPPGSRTTPSTATSPRRTPWSPRCSTTARGRLRSYLEHQMAKASDAGAAGAPLGRGRAVPEPTTTSRRRHSRCSGTATASRPGIVGTSLRQRLGRCAPA